MLSTRYLALFALLTLTGCPTKNSNPPVDADGGTGSDVSTGGAAGQGTADALDAGAAGAGSESVKLPPPDASTANAGGKPIAEGCAANSECASGYCVDGVCCNTACDDQCHSCDLPGNVGYCTAQITGEDLNAAVPCTGAHTCSIAISALNLVACRLKALQACKVGADCASLDCETFYVDHDGDGYGENSTTLSLCEVSGATSPGGYVTQGGDCCDSDASAFPGQTAYFTTEDACGAWDYSCDGTIETPNGQSSMACGQKLSSGQVNSSYTLGCR